jgi:hypothetical protein
MALVTLNNRSLVNADVGTIGQVKTVKINSNATESGSGSQGVKTNSTSYVDVGGLTLAITPSATSSTILAMYHAQHSNTDAGTDVSWSQIRMLRGSTTVSESTRAAGYMKNNHDNECSITLMEILA